MVNDCMTGYEKTQPEFTGKHPDYTVKCSNNVIKKEINLLH